MSDQSPSIEASSEVQEPGWPAANGRRVIFLLDASSKIEASLLAEWIERHRPEGVGPSGFDVIKVPASRRRSGKRDPRLESCLAGDDDPLMAPIRIAWHPQQIDGRRAARLSDLLTLGDPRDPDWLRQRWILRRHPDRCRVVVAEPAPLSDLRQRWRDACALGGDHTIGLADFVSRQATLALDRAERRLRGARYKVPRFVYEDILSRPAFRAGISRVAREVGKAEPGVLKQAGSYLREIAATHSTYVIDLVANLIHLLYSRAYGEALHYDRARLEEIYALTQRYPVVFLPSHKSNLDHLVLQYALHENGHPPNHTAGGINMNFFPVGPLVRRSGVFFIRRSFKDNPTYKFVLKQYIDYLIEKRFSLEWYVEGGRSRSGKLLPPRMGMLAYVADSFRRGKSEDVFLIPVSIAYDQIQDVSDYVAEQRGGPKEKESFGWFLKVIRRLRQNFGGIHIRFGEPLPLSRAITPSNTHSDVEEDEHTLALQKLAFEVCNRINDVTPLTPTSLVTLALLGTGDQALSLDETRNALRNLVVYVQRRKLPTTGPLELDTPEGVRRALDGLVASGVVTCFTEGPEAIYAISANQHLTAAYYRNTVIHFFLNGAIAELALLRAAEEDVADPMAEFWKEALQLRDWLKFEFFFPEKEAFRTQLREEITLHEPDWESLVRAGGSEILLLVRRFRPLSAHRVLRPFLDAYRVVFDALARRTPETPLEEPSFLNDCLALGKQYRLQRRIRSDESVSKVLFGTALSLARNRGLADPGGAELKERREVFATDLRRAVRRIDLVEALAAVRRSGLVE